MGVFNYWCSLGKPLIKHNTQSKVGIRSLKAIESKLSTNSPDDMKDAITNYHELLMSGDTYINPKLPGHLVSLDEFFRGFNGFTKGQMMKFKSELEIKNWFEECKPGMDPMRKFMLKNLPLEDNNPRLSTKLRRFYIKHIGIDQDFTQHELNAFIRASDSLMQFYNKTKGRFILPIRTDELAVMLGKSVVEYYDNLVEGCFCAEHTFRKVLPYYLKKQGVIN
jgi:hypothetical protein